MRPAVPAPPGRPPDTRAVPARVRITGVRSVRRRPGLTVSLRTDEALPGDGQRARSRVSSQFSTTKTLVAVAAASASVVRAAG